MQSIEGSGIVKRTRRMRRMAMTLWLAAPVVAFSAVIVSTFGVRVPSPIFFLINCIVGAGVAGGVGLWYRSDPVFDKNTNVRE
jgi:hypothetical protein